MGWKTALDVKMAALQSEVLPETARFEVPNLDGLQDNELSGLEWLFGRLASLAALKWEGMANRLAGDIEAALHHEKIFDRQYKELPKWARW